MRETKRLSAVAFACAAATLLASCYPGGPTSASQRDIVTTVFDESANFGAIRTYAMPDRVVILDDEEGSLPEETEALILNTIARNMEAIGYRRETSPETNGADVVVLVASNQTTTVTWWVSYFWWGPWGFWPGWGGWPGFGPGWGIGYPRVGVTVSTTGSLFIDMANPNEASNQVLPVAWSAGAAGLVAADEGFNQDRIAGGIDQMFRQSPYLGAR